MEQSFAHFPLFNETVSEYYIYIFQIILNTFDDPNEVL